MSANNVFCTPTEIHIFSDGTVLDAAKNIAGVCYKVRPFFGRNFIAAIGVTGSFHLMPMIEGAVVQSGVPLDRLEGSFSNLLSEFERRSRSLHHQPWGDYRATVAGWSDTDEKPICVAVRSFDEGNVPAFRAMRVMESIDPPTLFGFDASRPIESGIELLERQRAKIWGSDQADRVGAHLIGGFVLHTVVTRDGIQSKIIKRWNEDRIGSPIQPAPVLV